MSGFQFKKQRADQDLVTICCRVYSDLYGERGVLMGGIQGMFLAQYQVLRENGHSPSEAFNETVEEATQS
jgi:ketol-acid reductoisomerase